VVVVVNFSDQHLTDRVPNFPAIGNMARVDGSEVEVAEDGLVLDLPEYEASIIYQCS